MSEQNPDYMPPETVRSIEQKIKELEELIFVKQKMEAAGEDPLVKKDRMPIYDPEGGKRLAAPSQTDMLISSRDTLKKFLDDYFMDQMSRQMVGSSTEAF